MNVYEYAMQMELDGKAFYEKHAAKIEEPGLKKILLELANDEDKHYNIFKAMRDGKGAKYEEATQTKILESVKNVFEQLSDGDKDFTFPSNARDLWVEAREVEKKTEAFYREKAEELESDEQKAIFHRIADEEHRHWVTMENIIGFIDHPKNFIEDAEWSNIDEEM
jgi:rubrerythrin